MRTPLDPRAETFPRPAESPGAGWADWPIGVVEATTSGAILVSNAAAADLLAPFGVPREAADVFALFSAAAPDLRAVAERAKPGEPVRRRLRAPDGAGVALMMTRGATGRLTLLLTDDSAAARAEDEAQRSRARFAAVADWAPRSAIYALDRDGRVSAWSRSAERFEGVGAGEAVGMRLETLLERSHFGADAGLLLSEAARAGESNAASWRFAFHGAPAWVSLTIRAVRLADGALDGFVAIARDMTVVSQREAELRRLAETDPLTGALNRRAFFDTVRAAETALRRRGVAGLAVIAFDLDGFKSLNDGFGHAAGDAALRAMAEAARADVRSGDIIGRLGGDEFAVALPRADLARALAVAERLRATMEKLSVPFGETVLRFTASFGVAAPRGAAERFDETLARADAALYRAKAAGRNRASAG